MKLTDPTSQVIADRYEILGVIGRGGQGMVCRAKDLETQRRVAIKIIDGLAARNSETIERLAREQQALVALAGTNTVEFLDMCTTEKGKLCLVMELLDGQEFEKTLVDLENRGESCSMARLIEILKPIVSTLEKAHSVGIIHRDLKPGNIFVLSARAGGGARLLDFGFARLSDSKRVTGTGMVMGSPSYIAPEVWMRGVRDVDRRVDVYAFGVIVYRALAGELPFANRSMQQILFAATAAPRPSLHKRRPDLPPQVDDWVHKVLAINPEDRYQSISECWAELLWASGKTGRPQSAHEIGGGVEFDKIRDWLDEAPLSRQGGVSSPNGIWAVAASTFKRLLGGSSPSPPKGGAAAKPMRPMPTVRAGGPKRPKAPLPVPRHKVPTAPPDEQRTADKLAAATGAGPKRPPAPPRRSAMNDPPPEHTIALDSTELIDIRKGHFAEGSTVTASPPPLPVQRREYGGDLPAPTGAPPPRLSTSEADESAPNAARGPDSESESLEKTDGKQDSSEAQLEADAAETSKSIAVDDATRAKQAKEASKKIPTRSTKPTADTGKARGTANKKPRATRKRSGAGGKASQPAKASAADPAMTTTKQGPGKRPPNDFDRPKWKSRRRKGRR